MMMIIIINTKKKEEKEPTHTHIRFCLFEHRKERRKKTRVYDNKTTVGKRKRWTTPSTIRTKRRDKEEKKTYTLQTKNNPRCEI